MQLNSQNRTLKLGLLDVFFKSELVLDVMSGVSTHNPARDLIAQAVRYTVDVDYLTAIVTALLPKGYRSNTLREIPAMVAGALKKDFDKPPAKSVTELTSAALARGGIEIIVDQQREPYLGIPQKGGGLIYEPLRATAAKAYIRLIAFDAAGKPIKQEALTELIDTMEAKALYRGRQARLYLRFGEGAGAYIIDPGWETGERITIAADGWQISDVGHVSFRRAPGFGAMPRPGVAGGLKKVIDLLGLEGSNAILFVVFLMSCMRPAGPYMFLLVEGEQGSGKSLLSSVIRRIIDPNATGKSRLPKNEHELMISAGENFLLVFDNASSMRWDMSDALCSLATGSGYSTRRLYTDNESRTFNFARPVIINGIGQFANRPDFLERAIQLRLPKMAAGKRLSEKELEARFAELLPDVLADLLEATSVALRRMPLISPPTQVRMADAAHFAIAAEPALGYAPGTILETLVADQKETMTERALGDPLVLAIILIVQREGSKRGRKSFMGTVKDLLDKLKENGQRIDEKWIPPTPAHLSTQLKRLNPAFSTLGVVVTFEGRKHRGQEITISLAPDSLAAGFDEPGVTATEARRDKIS